MQVGTSFLFIVTVFKMRHSRQLFPSLQHDVRKIKISAGSRRQTATAGYLWHILYIFRQSVTCVTSSVIKKKTLKFKNKSRLEVP